MKKELNKHINKTFNIEFNNQQLLYTALTHSSYANDYRELNLEHLERLEFLGDAVIELLVSDYLFREYEDLPEGQLTKMRANAVREESLAQLTIDTELQPFIMLGKGEVRSSGRNRVSLLCDVFEAFIGAVYLDKGIQEAERILSTILYPKINAGEFAHAMDYKTTLQEWLQKDGIVQIEYKILEISGPDHAREYKIGVFIEGDKLGIGIGSSKKRAEQAAAQKAYEQLDF